MRDKEIIIIGGPTAVGKTGISIEYAERIGGEIISADSVQVYKYMDIGSAKITPDEMKGIRHHLIDILDPSQDFGVDRFVEMASASIDDILARGKVPVIVGGTAFYIQALLKGVDFNDEDDCDRSYRDELGRIADSESGKQELHQRLLAIDPEYADKTPYQNSRRVIRALEYYHNTGRRFSDYNREQMLKPPKYNYRYYAITDDRDELYNRINKRVDIMFSDGLVDEVIKLRDMGYDRSLKSMNSIGYKETWAYICNEISLDEAVTLVKLNTRHFAKRQLTWLRREDNIIWLDRSHGSINID